MLLALLWMKSLETKGSEFTARMPCSAELWLAATMAAFTSSMLVLRALWNLKSIRRYVRGRYAQRATVELASELG